MTDGDERRWKVGELARATGLTVRALHHYDEVGLVVPSERTSARHRLYSGDDVRRLYRVVALRRLGIGLEQIATVLDSDELSLVETVRRHLEQVERELEHHQLLRDRLRRMLDALERRVEPSVEEFIDAVEAMSVIEAKVEDVLIRLPAEQVEEPPPRLARERSRIAVLREQSGDRELAIWIGAQEGDLLAAGLGEWSQERPMGPDFTTRLLEAGGVRVERVVIESVRGSTYYATVSVTAGVESHEIDARPSDALNLALRVGAPVLIAQELFDKAGYPAEARRRMNDPSNPPEGRDWLSLSPDVVRSLYPREAMADWERFTPAASQVITRAGEEARSLGHERIGPEHVLVGLLLEQDTIAADVLGALGVTLERARQRLAPQSVKDAVPGLLPPIETTQKALQLALREEGTSHPRAVGPEHVLLGLIEADESIRDDFGITTETVREEIRRATPPT